MFYASRMTVGGLSANGSFTNEGSEMAHSVREVSDLDIDSEKTSRALNAFFRRERQTQDDRASIWLVSAGMLTILIVLLTILVLFSRPKNTHLSDSVWFHTLPLFKTSCCEQSLS